MSTKPADTNDVHRCAWTASPHMAAYHDTEWGVPMHDDRLLFEFIVLEGAQAGLSWDTILRRRENYRAAFDNFDPDKVARYTQKKIDKLLTDTGIIRNKLKINSAVTNAQAFLAIAEKHGSFADYIWQFVNHKPIVNAWTNRTGIPAVTPMAELISRDLKKRGFKFMGPTIVYAHMQATGMVNDHTTDCFRWRELGGE